MSIEFQKNDEKAAKEKIQRASRSMCRVKASRKSVTKAQRHLPPIGCHQGNPKRIRTSTGRHPRTNGAGDTQILKAAVDENVQKRGLADSAGDGSARAAADVTYKRM